MEIFDITGVFTPLNMVYLVLSTLYGAVFGAMPGLAATIALAILIPFVAHLPPTTAMMVCGGILGGTIFAGSIPAILFNIPGTPENIATTFDGHALARKGQAGRAIGISATASALGALASLAIFAVAIFFVRKIIWAFSFPEIFLFILFGLLTIAVLSKGNLIKALAAAGFGILVSLVGVHSASGVLRFTFGIPYLWDGVKTVPVFLGIFAVGEMISLSVQGGTIAGRMYTFELKQTIEGMKDVFRHWVCFVRSLIIGFIVGFIPGIGATTANILAYGIAVQTSKHPETFGTGEIEGLVASETGNNASQGGDILPTAAFGIPGSVYFALVMAVMMLVGVTPGPFMVKEHPNVIMALFWSLVISNVLISVLGVFAARWIARLTTIEVGPIIPVIIVISLVGVYAADKMITDIIVAIAFGFIGYAMVVWRFPRSCFVIAFILGDLAEGYFHSAWAMGYGTPIAFFTRPLSLSIIIFAVAIFLFNMGRRLIRARRLTGAGRAS